MTLKEYWLALQQSIVEFDNKKYKEAEIDADKQSYLKQRMFLVQLAAMGVKFEGSSLCVKMLLAHELKSFPEKALGEEKLVTTFGGPLSLAFAEEVFLPHILRFNEVSLDDQNLITRKVVNLEQEKLEAQSSAKKLEAAIQSHKKNYSPLVALNTFQPVKSGPSVEKAKEEAHTSTP